MDVLIQFLVAHLPAALVAEMGGLAAVVVAVIAMVLKYVPGARKKKRWLAPVLALVMGQVAGFIAVGIDVRLWPQAAGLGVLIALTAIGGHSSGKNIGKAMSNVRQPKKVA